MKKSIELLSLSTLATIVADAELGDRTLMKLHLIYTGRYLSYGSRMLPATVALTVSVQYGVKRCINVFLECIFLFVLPETLL